MTILFVPRTGFLLLGHILLLFLPLGCFSFLADDEKGREDDMIGLRNQRPRRPTLTDRESHRVLELNAPKRSLLNCTVNLTTVVTSELLVKLNESSNQSSLEELGQDIVETYNDLLNATYGPCETTKYRQITNISVIASTLSRRRNTRRSSRFLKDLSMVETIFRLEGHCGGCDSNEMFFDSNVVSSDDFVGHYSSLVDSGLAYINEIVTWEQCPSNNTIFEDWIIVEFVPEDLYSDSLLNNDALIQQLEEIFVDTYNERALEYCDPNSRRIQSAEITFVGTMNILENIPVQMHVVGTCSNCNKFDMGVFDVPSYSSPIQSSRRYLQWSSGGSAISSQNGICYCPAHPIDYRGQFEVEFLDAYRNAVNSTTFGSESQVVVALDSTHHLVSVAECSFGTKYQTVIAVQFLATRDNFDDVVLNKIESALNQSITTLYATNETTCNPEFRTVGSVTSTVVTSPTRRRSLGSSHPHRFVQELSPSPAPTVSPSTIFMPSYVNLTFPSLNSSTSTGIYLYVSGMCNGCSNMITFDDLTEDSRRLQETNDQLLVATSNCFCPIGATINATAPTLDQLLALFATNLEQLGITFPIQEFGEIEPPSAPMPVPAPVAPPTEATFPPVEAIRPTRPDHENPPKESPPRTPEPTVSPTKAPTFAPRTKKPDKTPVPTSTPSTSPSLTVTIAGPSPCSTAKDCSSDGNQYTCVANVCIRIGELRFTLTWFGDDDLDLSVLPPGGNLIDFNVKTDSVTGGQLDVDIIPNTNSTNVENINFVSQPPSGTYQVCVTNFRQTGDAEEYTLEVYEGNKKKLSTKATTLNPDQMCKDYELK